MKYLFSIDQVYQVTFVLFAFGATISTLEFLVTSKMFSQNGMLTWNILQIRWGSLGQIKVFRKLFNDKGMKALLIIRVLFLSVLFIIPVGTPLWTILLSGLTLNYLITNLNTYFGSDGSDQLNSIILVTILLCTMPFANQALLSMGIIFIAGQSCLSYLSAGVSKLVSESWRSGRAVKDIFKTRTYGSAAVTRYLSNKSMLSAALCWIVIIVEILFPLTLFLPLEWASIFFVWGIVFHVLNAVIMGLNSFLWSFLATYPAILYMNLVIIH